MREIHSILCKCENESCKTMLPPGARIVKTQGTAYIDFEKRHKVLECLTGSGSIFGEYESVTFQVRTLQTRKMMASQDKQN